jgi:hypothetical protein
LNDIDTWEKYQNEELLFSHLLSAEFYKADRIEQEYVERKYKD